MSMKLIDRADGIRGHFCIGRLTGNGLFWEFWNKGIWKAVGQVFVGKTVAERKLKSLRKAAFK